MNSQAGWWCVGGSQLAHPCRALKNGVWVGGGWSKRSFICLCQNQIEKKTSLFPSLPKPFKFCLVVSIVILLREASPSGRCETKIGMVCDDRGQLGKQKEFLPSYVSLALNMRQERRDVPQVRSLRGKIIFKMSVLLRKVSFTTPHCLMHRTKRSDCISWGNTKT